MADAVSGGVVWAAVFAPEARALGDLRLEGHGGNTIRAYSTIRRYFCRFKYSSIARRMCSATDNPVFSASALRRSISCSGRKMFVRFIHHIIHTFLRYNMTVAHLEIVICLDHVIPRT